MYSKIRCCIWILKIFDVQIVFLRVFLMIFFFIFHQTFEFVAINLQACKIKHKYLENLPKIMLYKISIYLLNMKSCPFKWFIITRLDTKIIQNNTCCILERFLTKSLWMHSTRTQIQKGILYSKPDFKRSF